MGYEHQGQPLVQLKMHCTFKLHGSLCDTLAKAAFKCLCLKVAVTSSA
jgi:hypothetical protein